ncbi:MAG: M24 family metallopeptidase [Rhodospirillaceae bacterium]
MDTTALRLERKRRLGEMMAREGWDTLVVAGNAWHNDGLRYVSDLAVVEGEAIAVIDSGGDTAIYVECPIEAERAAVEAPGVAVAWAADLAGAVAGHLRRLGNRRMATSTPALLPLALGGGGLADGEAAFDRLLLEKSAVEVAAIRRAADIADAGYREFMRAARPGRREYELVAEVEGWLRAHGAADNFMIIGSGGREVMGMHPPGARALQAGDMVTTELTPCVDGYYAQICRTLVIGPPTEAQRHAFALFRAAMEAGIAAVKPGARACDVAKAENDVFRRAGLGNYVTSEYTRVRGHGMGLFVDTKPHILEDVETPLVPGMTLIVHPNTYHPEVGYLVLGDAVAVTETGCEVLCRTPRELFSVPAQ